jgi:hypothetical protein
MYIYICKHKQRNTQAPHPFLPYLGGGRQEVFGQLLVLLQAIGQAVAAVLADACLNVWGGDFVYITYMVYIYVGVFVFVCVCVCGRSTGGRLFKRVCVCVCVCVCVGGKGLVCVCVGVGGCWCWRVCAYAFVCRGVSVLFHMFHMWFVRLIRPLDQPASPPPLPNRPTNQPTN